MVTIKDKANDVWGWYDLNHKGYVKYEDGTVEKIHSRHIVFTSGKYVGKLLSDVSDVWYLNYIKKRGVDTGDWFLENCAKLRLLELK